MFHCSARENLEAILRAEGNILIIFLLICFPLIRFRVNRTLLLTLILFVLLPPLRAQEKPVICLNENDGLCDNEVRWIIRDHRDILWIGTNNGLSAYDGNRFVCYRKSDGLAGSRVWALAVDGQNRVYVGCYAGGLNRISGGRITDTWHIPDRNVRNTIRKLLYDEKNRALVVGTDYGIYLFRDSVFHKIRYPYPPEHKKSSILSLKRYRDHIYMTVHNYAGGLYELKIDADSLERSTVIPLIQNVSFFALTFAGDTIYTNSSGDLYAYSLKTSQGGIIAEIPKGFLPWDMVTLPSPWIMAGGFKIADYAANTKFFSLRQKRFVKAPWMLHSDQIFTYCFDTLRKIVWTGTANGLKAVVNTPFTYYREGEGEIIDLAFRQDTLFVLKDQGLFMLRGGDLVPLLTKDQIDRVLLQAAERYCARIDTNLFEHPRDKTVIYRYFVRDNGRIFINTNKGSVSVPDLSGYLPFYDGHFLSRGNGFLFIRDYLPMVYCPDVNDITRNVKLTDKKVRSIKDVLDIRRSGDVIYMPSYFNGLYALSGEKIYQLNGSNSDMDNFINGIDIDSKGDAWVISLEGDLFQVGFKDSLYVKRKINRFNSEIAGESYKWLLFNNGYLYLATNKGLNIVPEEELQKGEIRSLWLYNRYNGYLDLATYAPVKAGRGYLFVHNGKRLIRIGNPVRKKGLCELRMRHLTVDGKTYPADSLDHTVFPSHTGNIRMTFYLLKYPTDRNVVYRYRVNDGDWTATNTVSLSYMKPGRYHLTLEAKDLERDEVYRRAVVFVIKTPGWMRLWFILGMLTSLLMTGYIVMRYRYQLLRRREEEKNRMIRESAELQVKALQLQMNPHFIFNALNTIQSAVLTRSREETLDFIGDLSLVIRENLENVTKDLIPLSREIAFLRRYADVERFRLGGKVSIDFVVAVEDPEKLMIPPMLVQPLIENSIKHGILPKKEGGEIEVRFEQEVDHLVITVRDNGIGRKAAMERTRRNHHHSKGIELLKKRLEYLNLKNNTRVNRIAYEDLYDGEHPAGTVIRLYLQIILRKKEEENT